MLKIIVNLQTLHLERLENEAGKTEKQKEKEYIPSPEQESVLKACFLWTFVLTNSKDFFHSMMPQSEDYYPTVVLDHLMRFLKNPLGPIAHVCSQQQ